MGLSIKQLKELLHVLKGENKHLVPLPKLKKVLKSQKKKVDEEQALYKVRERKKLSPEDKKELIANREETNKRVLVLNQLVDIYVQLTAPVSIANSLAEAAQNPRTYPTMPPPSPRAPKRKRNQGEGKDNAQKATNADHNLFDLAAMPSTTQTSGNPTHSPSSGVARASTPESKEIHDAALTLSSLAKSKVTPITPIRTGPLAATPPRTALERQNNEKGKKRSRGI